MEEELSKLEEEEKRGVKPKTEAGVSADKKDL